MKDFYIEGRRLASDLFLEVRQPLSSGEWRTKSRLTVNTKSGFVRYIFVRNLSTISIVMSDRPLTKLSPDPSP